MKKMIALILVLALLLSLSACKKDKKPKKVEIATTEDVFEKIQENMDNAKSMTGEIDLLISMSAMGESLDMDTSMDLVLIQEPLAMKVDAEVDMGILGSVDTSIYCEEVNGEMVVYTYAEGTWTKEKADLEDLAQYNSFETMTTYLNSTEEIKEIGTETVDGVSTTRYDCTVAKDKLAEVLTASGAFDQFSELGITLDESAFEDMDNQVYSIWIDTENYLPVKCEMDMTNYLNTLMNNFYKSLGNGIEIKVTKTVMTLVYTGFNNVEAIDFDVPEDIRVTP